MNVVEAHDTFQFHDDQAVHDQVYTLTVEVNVTVFDAYGALRFVREPGCRQFDL
jgi:hypothetical protein